MTAYLSYLSYLVPLAALLYVGLLLWRSGDPPSAGYLTFAFFAGAVMLMVALDTGWYRRTMVVSVAEPLFDDAGGVQQGIDEIKEAIRRFRGDVAAVKGAVLGHRRDVDAVKESLAGYQTEVFDPRADGKHVEVGAMPEGDAFASWVRFTLTYPPVPDSVLIWENGLLVAPNRFSVDANAVTVKTLVDAQAQRLDYTIRYLRRPTTGQPTG